MKCYTSSLELLSTPSVAVVHSVFPSGTENSARSGPDQVVLCHFTAFRNSWVSLAVCFGLSSIWTVKCCAISCVYQQSNINNTSGTVALAGHNKRFCRIAQFGFKCFLPKSGFLVVVCNQWFALCGKLSLFTFMKVPLEYRLPSPSECSWLG